MADVDELVDELRLPAGEAAGAIVLLHGRGTSEHDLAPLLDVFDPRRRLVGAFPRGPLQLPPIGHHWYAVEDGRPDPETFHATFERLGAWLERPRRAHRGADRAHRARRLLPGRGDGLGAGAGARPSAPGRDPRHERRPPRRAGFDLQLDGLAGLPVAITHGTQDPIISIDLARDARDRARAAGADVVYRETDVPHIVDPRVVPGLWLELAATHAAVVSTSGGRTTSWTPGRFAPFLPARACQWCTR